MSASSLPLADRVRDFAKAEGIDEFELRDMLRRSARVSHKQGNRRYHQFLFMVTDSEVCYMTKLAFDNSYGCGIIEVEARKPRHGEFLVLEDCPKCGSWGCLECGFSGQTKVIRQDNQQVFKE